MTARTQRGSTKRVAAFASEAELCATFIAAATALGGHYGIPRAAPEWVAYPETAGFDILMVRAADGFQIGIEAKLHLNQTVLQQALEGLRHDPTSPGPDCIAVLVPDGSGREPLSLIARFCGITVIRCRAQHDGLGGYSPIFQPALPRLNDRSSFVARDWFENLPTRRESLPDYIPDVTAGASAPTQLTHWKIGALKIAVLMERQGFVGRTDFKHVGIDYRRWTGQQWLVTDSDRGGWVPGPYWPDFKRQHPTNFEQIAADYARWAPHAIPAAQVGLNLSQQAEPN